MIFQQQNIHGIFDHIFDETPVSIAKEKGYDDIVQFLENS